MARRPMRMLMVLTFVASMNPAMAITEPEQKTGWKVFRVLSKETACAKQGILTLRPYISLIADQKVGEMA